MARACPTHNGCMAEHEPGQRDGCAGNGLPSTGETFSLGRFTRCWPRREPMGRPIAYTPRIAPEILGYSGCPFLCMLALFTVCVLPSTPLHSTRVAGVFLALAGGTPSRPVPSRLYVQLSAASRLPTPALLGSCIVGRRRPASRLGVTPIAARPVSPAVHPSDATTACPPRLADRPRRRAVSQRPH